MFDAKMARKVSEDRSTYSSFFWTLLGGIKAAAKNGQTSYSRDIHWIPAEDVARAKDELISLGYTAYIEKGHDESRAKEIERYWNCINVKW